MINIDSVLSLIKADFKAVDHCIQQRLESDIVLINELSRYIINSGGKRLRPVLTLLAAKACGYEGEHHVQSAAIIEFIHTATLLHDDVVDASELRRGKETANALFGNEASVLVGDFLYSRAFEMMVEIENMQIMGIFANTTNVIAEGEVMQLLNIHNAEISEEDYLRVILSKTAKLFEAATLIGSVLAGQDAQQQADMAAYGMHLGTAFQLVDDVLDYTSDAETLGKNIGDDLAEGKPTLPLIYALQHAKATDADKIKAAIVNGEKDNAAEIIAIVQNCGAIEYTMQAARKEVLSACRFIDKLPDTDYKCALMDLAKFSVERLQ